MRVKLVSRARFTHQNYFMVTNNLHRYYVWSLCQLSVMHKIHPDEPDPFLGRSSLFRAWQYPAVDEEGSGFERIAAKAWSFRTTS